MTLHDIGLVLIASGIALHVGWRLGHTSGIRDERDRIGCHLLKLRREQEQR